MQAQNLVSGTSECDVCSTYQLNVSRQRRVCSLRHALLGSLVGLFGFQVFGGSALAPISDSSHVLDPVASDWLASNSEASSFTRHSLFPERSEAVKNCLVLQKNPQETTCSTWVHEHKFEYGGVIFEQDEFHTLREAEADAIMQVKADLADAGKRHSTNYVFAKLSVIYDELRAEAKDAGDVTNTGETKDAGDSSNARRTNDAGETGAETKEINGMKVTRGAMKVAEVRDSSQATGDSEMKAAPDRGQALAQGVVPDLRKRGLVPREESSVGETKRVQTLDSRAKRAQQREEAKRAEEAKLAEAMQRADDIKRAQEAKRAQTSKLAKKRLFVERTHNVQEAKYPVLAESAGTSATSGAQGETRYVRKALSSFLTTKCYNSGAKPRPIASNECEGWKLVFANEGNFLDFLYDHLPDRVSRDNSINLKTQSITYAHSEQALLGALLNDAESCSADGPQDDDSKNCELYTNAKAGGWKDHLCSIELFLLDVYSIPNSVCITCDASFKTAQFAKKYTEALDAYCKKIGRWIPPRRKLAVFTSSVIKFLHPNHISCAGCNYTMIMSSLVADSEPVTFHRSPTRSRICQECAINPTPCALPKSLAETPKNWLSPRPM